MEGWGAKVINLRVLIGIGVMSNGADRGVAGAEGQG